MKRENDNLTERLQKLQAVQILSAGGTVYAEGQFQDGYFGNPSFWIVRLPKQLVSCPLSELTNVQICIGGIRKAQFRADSSVICGYEPEEGYTNGWGRIQFDLGVICFLAATVGPFPSEEVFRSQVLGGIEINRANRFAALTQELAVHHPELSVTFGVVGFHISDVKVAIQNLALAPVIEEETQRGGAATAAENGAEDDADGVASDVKG
jgi:hypothetical protein